MLLTIYLLKTTFSGFPMGHCFLLQCLLLLSSLYQLPSSSPGCVLFSSKINLRCYLFQDASSDLPPLLPFRLGQITCSFFLVPCNSWCMSIIFLTLLFYNFICNSLPPQDCELLEAQNNPLLAEPGYRGHMLDFNKCLTNEWKKLLV